MIKSHCQKLLSLFDQENALIYIKGGSVQHRYDTDTELAFRQESNFLYLTGVEEPDFHFLLDVTSGEGHLIIPRRSVQYAVWNGIVRSKEHYQSQFGPDHIHYDDELDTLLSRRKPEKLFVLDRTHVDGMPLGSLQLVDTGLREALVDCRLIKTALEIEYLRHAGKITSLAHIEVMKAVCAEKYEHELKAVFEYHCVRHGLQAQAYNGIYGSGPNSAILHYVENNRQMKKGELFLIDAGAEWHGYAHDVTRTYPVNGTFDSLQAGVYDAVLSAHKNSIDRAKPGVKMEDLHLSAAKDLLQGLKDADLVYGNLDELMEKNVFALFFPHGLGHFMGLDVHDPGGYPKGVERIDRPGIRFLRARRMLEPGMVVTIEPGCYFIPALLEPAFEDAELRAHLNVAALTKMMSFGGIRIEDNLLITANGYENLTNIPKERTEIESLMLS
jgi:Xaa-Pro dipeptidase